MAYEWFGTNFNDTKVWPNDGINDKMFGYGGDDSLGGGSGDDTIYGGYGNDTLKGGDGKDYLYGEAGNDYLDGWTGNDYLNGGDGHDKLLGYYGNDTLFGGDGNDSLYGEADNDYLDGWNGHDYLSGGSGHDTLLGYDGNDTLNGGSGSDVLKGERGNDILNGYGFTTGEYDVLSGENGASKPGVKDAYDGADTFVLGDKYGAYYLGAGYATVTDFYWNEGDKFQVHGKASDYSLGYANWEGTSAQDTLIKYKGDVIGVVQDTTNVIISADFNFV